MEQEAFLAAWQKSANPASLFADQLAVLNDTTVIAMKDYLRDLRRSDPQRALALADSMFLLAGMTGQPAHRALAAIARGNVQMARAEYRQAICDYEEAHRISLAEQRPLDAARAYIGMIFCLQKLARYDEALRCAAEIRPILEAHGEWALAAGVDSNTASVYHIRGDFRAALALLDRALALLARAGSAARPDAIAPLFEKAELLYSLKRYHDAQHCAEQVRDIATANDCRSDLARVDRFMAKIAAARGQYTLALRLLNRAEAAFTASDLLKDRLSTRKAILDCYLALNRFNAVLDESPSLIAGFQQLGLLNSAGQVMLKQVQAYSHLQRYDDALALLDRAVAFFTEHRIGDDLARIAELRAELLLAAHRLSEALQAAGQAKDTWQSAGLPIDEARADLLEARILERQGNHDRAKALAKQALALAGQEDVPPLRFAAYQQIGQLAEQEEAFGRALDAYLACITIVEELRHSIVPELRSDFVADKELPYQAAVQLALDRGSTAQAFALTEQAKSRTLVELLANRGGLDIRIKVRQPEDAPLVAELERLREERNSLIARAEQVIGHSGQNPEQNLALQQCEARIDELLVQLQVRSAAYSNDASLFGEKPVEASAIQAQLDSDTVLLEYFIARDEVLAWTLDRNQITVQRKLCSAAQLSTLLSRLQLALATPTIPGGERVACLHLARLYSLLVAPLVERLHGFRSLIVVPHGPLHHLPFHALYDPISSAYLIEQFEISYLPCASLLPILTARATACSPASSRPEALIVAYSGEGEQRLRYVQEEARAVAGLLPCTLLLEAEATVEAIENSASRHHLLHLAAHGRFRSNEPLFSAIQLAGGELTVLDIFNLDLHASLVTLSACETGASAVRGGDELIGLARACFYAGAASLVLTLWRVEDHASCDLITHFYNALLAGCTKAAALRAAQLAHLRSENYRHPYYWAPFTLSGADTPL